MLGLSMGDLFDKPLGQGMNNGQGKKYSGGPSVAWEIKDRHGNVKGVHVRFDYPDGTKKVLWRMPDMAPGKWGLNGTPLGALPLYGAHELDDEAAMVVVTEGEQARDALAEALKEAPGVAVVGTVTGASVTPGPEALEDLRGMEVVLWPDTDQPGIEHMDRLAGRLRGIASVVRIFEWCDAPIVMDEKGKPKGQDAADHPAVESGDEKAVGILLNDIYGAPEHAPPREPEGLQGRVLLGDLLRGGIEPTPQLIDGFLYEGRIHSVAGPPGAGKTLLALWAAIKIMKQGTPVLYIDAENGQNIIGERLRDLGADLDCIDELFHYHPTEIGIRHEDVAQLMGTVKRVRPALVIFDSMVDMLAVAGLKENENDDCIRWIKAVAEPIRDEGLTTLILDHVPKGGKGPRGGGAKMGGVDLQWGLEVKQQFDRRRVGEIELVKLKEREGWMPHYVRFSVGGTKDGELLFERSAGTIEEPMPDREKPLNGTAQKALDLLRSQGREGAEWKDLETAVGNPASTSRAIKELEGRKLSYKENGRHYDSEVKVVYSIETPDEDTSAYFHLASMKVHENDESQDFHHFHHPLGVEG